MISKCLRGSSVGIFVILCSIILTVSGCGRGDSDSTSNGPAQDLLSMKVGGHSTIYGVALVAAKDLGIFKKHGLDVTVETVKSSSQSMAALLAGELDLSLGTAAAGNLNMMAKSDLSIVADGGRTVPQLILRKSLLGEVGVEKLSDLKGLKVSVPREGSGSWYALHRVLSAVGLGIADLTPKFLGQREAAAAIKTGDLDAAILSEPTTSVVLDDGTGVLFCRDKMEEIFPGLGQQYVVLYASEKTVQNRDLLVRFMAAYSEIIDVYNRALDGEELARGQIYGVASSHTGIDPVVLGRIQWPQIPRDLKPDIAYIKTMQSVFHDEGLVEQPVALETRINLSFLPGAN